MEHSNPLLSAVLSVYESSTTIKELLPNAYIDSLYDPHIDLKEYYTRNEYLIDEFRPFMLLPKGWYMTKAQGSEFGKGEHYSLEYALEWILKTNYKGFQLPVDFSSNNYYKGEKCFYHIKSLEFILKYFIQMNKTRCDEFFIVNRDMQVLPITGVKGVSKFLEEYFNIMSRYVCPITRGKVDVFQEVFNCGGWRNGYNNYLHKFFTNEDWMCRLDANSDDDKFYLYYLKSKGSGVTTERHTIKRSTKGQEYVKQLTEEVRGMAEEVINGDGYIPISNLYDRFSQYYPNQSIIIITKQVIKELNHMCYDVEKKTKNKVKCLIINKQYYTTESIEKT